MPALRKTPSVLSYQKPGNHCAHQGSSDHLGYGRRLGFRRCGAHSCCSHWNGVTQHCLHMGVVQAEDAEKGKDWHLWYQCHQQGKAADKHYSGRGSNGEQCQCLEQCCFFPRLSACRKQCGSFAACRRPQNACWAEEAWQGHTSPATRAGDEMRRIGQSMQLLLTGPCDQVQWHLMPAAKFKSCLTLNEQDLLNHRSCGIWKVKPRRQLQVENQDC